MAKSDKFPGQGAGIRVTGIRQPTEIAEPNLRVSVADMLAAQRATTQPNQEENSAAGDSALGFVAEIPTGAIRTSPFQPRLVFSEAAIEDLANSISAIGLVKPLTVRPIGTEYELIGGERRWRAHKLLGHETVKAYVIQVPDSVARILAITDNEGQETLTEYERGRAYSIMLAAGDEPSIRSLSRRIGVNHSVVSRCLLLMDLPPNVRQILDVNPNLIGGKWAKDFVAYGKAEPDLLLNAVKSMRDESWTQERALRWIAKEVASRAEQADAVRKFAERPVDGVGKLRLSQRRLEVVCEKGIDPQRLMEAIEKYLKNIDPTVIQVKD